MELKAIIDLNDGILSTGHSKIRKYFSERDLLKRESSFYTNEKFLNREGELPRGGRYLYINYIGLRDPQSFYHFLSGNGYALLDSIITKEKGE